jgi:hypothetical protein
MKIAPSNSVHSAALCCRPLAVTLSMSRGTCNPDAAFTKSSDSPDEILPAATVIAADTRYAIASVARHRDKHSQLGIGMSLAGQSANLANQ